MLNILRLDVSSMEVDKEAGADAPTPLGGSGGARVFWIASLDDAWPRGGSGGPDVGAVGDEPFPPDRLGNFGGTNDGFPYSDPSLPLKDNRSVEGVLNALSRVCCAMKFMKLKLSAERGGSGGDTDDWVLEVVAWRDVGFMGTIDGERGGRVGLGVLRAGSRGGARAELAELV